VPGKEKREARDVPRRKTRGFLHEKRKGPKGESDGPSALFNIPGFGPGASNGEKIGGSDAPVPMGSNRPPPRSLPKQKKKKTEKERGQQKRETLPSSSVPQKNGEKKKKTKLLKETEGSAGAVTRVGTRHVREKKSGKRRTESAAKGKRFVRADEERAKEPNQETNPVMGSKGKKWK